TNATGPRARASDSRCMRPSASFNSKSGASLPTASWLIYTNLAWDKKKNGDVLLFPKYGKPGDVPILAEPRRRVRLNRMTGFSILDELTHDGCGDRRQKNAVTIMTGCVPDAWNIA